MAGVELVAVSAHRSDVSSVISNPEIDAVVIATPPMSHFALVRQALAAGKHVLVEKPMTASLDEALELQTLVKNSGRVFMVGHQYLYNDHMRALKHEIEKGTLGTVHYFFSEHLYYRRERADVGSFWDGATHEFAIADYLFGLGEIKTANGYTINVTGEGDRDDVATANVEFDNGLLLNMVTSRLYPQNVRRMGRAYNANSRPRAAVGVEPFQVLQLSMPRWVAGRRLSDPFRIHQAKPAPRTFPSRWQLRF